MDIKEIKEYLTGLEANHSASVEQDKVYLEKIKTNKEYSPKDYNIVTGHTINEYFHRFYKYLKTGQVLVFKKDELWLMDPKATYWEIKNDSDFLYFEKPSKKLVPFALPIVNWGGLFTARNAIIGLSILTILFASLFTWKALTSSATVTTTEEESGHAPEFHIGFDAGEGNVVETYGSQKVYFPIREGDLWLDVWKNVNYIGALKDEYYLAGWSLDGETILSEQYAIKGGEMFKPVFRKKPTDVLCLVNYTDKSNYSIGYWSTGDNPDGSPINGYYKINDGEWLNIPHTAAEGGGTYAQFSLNAGDEVYIKGSGTGTSPAKIYSTGEAPFAVCGNLNALVNGKNYVPNNSKFISLFNGGSSTNNNVVSAYNLDISFDEDYETGTSSLDETFQFLFQNQKRLLSGPRKIKVPRITTCGLRQMFEGCSSLIIPPEIITKKLKKRVYMQYLEGAPV